MIDIESAKCVWLTPSPEHQTCEIALKKKKMKRQYIWEQGKLIF